MCETPVYEGLEPAELWRHFAALNGMPRGSGNEAEARNYVRQVTEASEAACQTDDYGNVVVYIAATESCANAPAVAIQAHLDMVCQKRPEVQHDFARDPIRPRREGDRIYASGTTLGADNGIGAAAALALLTTPGLRHGPLELLFTIEEETGLYGAANLDPALVSARLMINLDSEDPREITVGCAGGAGTSLHLRPEWRDAPDGWNGCEVKVGGLKGGHSGVQIHERLANAIKLLTRSLLHLKNEGIPFALAAIEGGSAHNAIPRDAVAQLAVPPSAQATLDAALKHIEQAIRTEWHDAEPDFVLTACTIPPPPEVLAEASLTTLLHLLNSLPHGVLTMSQAFHDKVETSSNLAAVHTEGDGIEIATSTRSFVMAEMERVQGEIAALGEKAGASVQVRDGYPGWQPDPESPLLQIAASTYETLFDSKPEIQVIHAGLECGILLDRLPGMQAISFGPRIEGAHTPEEHVYPATVKTTWKLLLGILEALCS